MPHQTQDSSSFSHNNAYSNDKGAFGNNQLHDIF